MADGGGAANGASGCGEDLVALPLGTVARVVGLKAIPGLNGDSCQLLRPGEPGSGRVVVRTRLGEKALKPANLQVGMMAVIPRLTRGLVVLLLCASLITLGVAMVGLGGHGTAPLVPLFAVAWVVFTALATGMIYWPCKPPGTRIPAFAVLGGSAPLSHLFRLGLLMVGLLLASTIFLQRELVFDRLADVSPDMVEEVVNNSIARAIAMRGNSDNETVANVTERLRRNTSDVRAELENAPSESAWWGYVAVGGAVLQAAFPFESRMSIRSAAHVVGFCVFVAGLGSHGSYTSYVLNSPRAAPLKLGAPRLEQVIELRSKAVNYAPLVLTAMPLLSQMSSRGGLGTLRGNQRTPGNFIEESGLIGAAISLQWMSLLVFIVYYGSFACDFYVGAQLL